MATVDSAFQRLEELEKATNYSSNSYQLSSGHGITNSLPGFFILEEFTHGFGERNKNLRGTN
jgi:hypothetical protein